jgi:magnesium transporter
MAQGSVARLLVLGCGRRVNLTDVTTAEASRPIPLSRVWSRNKIIAEDLAGEDLSDVLELHSDASAWWVLPRNDPYAERELRGVAGALDLDELAIHDLLADDRRVKYEQVGQARIVITGAVSVDDARQEVLVHPLSIIATDRALICLAGDTEALRPAQILTGQTEKLAALGIESALPLVLNAVIASYEDAVDWIEQRSDQLADLLFEDRPLDRPAQLSAFRLKRALSALRQLTEPMRSVIEELIDNLPPASKANRSRSSQTARAWNALAERHSRVANAANAQGEALGTIFQTSLSLVDVRSNEIMKKLSGWAAIIAVPTLVSGFVGMNVTFPLEGSVAGFWIYFVIMVAAAAILFVLLRARGWV